MGGAFCVNVASLLHLGQRSVALAAAAGRLHPFLAAVAMVVSSLTVLTNSLRIGAVAEP